MTRPIASLLIVRRGQDTNMIYVDSDTLRHAKTYSMKRRRFRVYRNFSGDYEIPPEWAHEGVTIVGRNHRKHEDAAPLSVKYMFISGVHGLVRQPASSLE